MISLPEGLLVLLLVGLFSATFYACFGSTKGPVSILNLKAQLLLVKRKFENQSVIDPEEERSVMERLQNKTKTSCSREAISSNNDLRALFFVNCESVNGMRTSSVPTNKTGWLRYGALMNDFNEQYFTRTANP